MTTEDILRGGFYGVILGIVIGLFLTTTALHNDINRLKQQNNIYNTCFGLKYKFVDYRNCVIQFEQWGNINP